MSSAFAIIFADCSFVWCQALVCRSGSKDICTLQHGFLCFLLFICLYFYSLPCIITHVCYFNFLAPFPQIWKYVTKSQYSPELKPFLTLSRMYNTVCAPDEFFPLTSTVKRQPIYYFYMSKFIYPSCKTP